ncbi:MAG: alpha-glucan family phosphorylase, partial [Bacteroidota bacterium]
FLFAGKAHPADQGGQDLIRHITYLSKQPDFAGKIIFLEDYNMEMAKLLTQGVDIWLNTPTRPKEASGTSGMKAALNGSVNFSVLDGWWAEGYRPDAGWALPLERTYQDQALQNELDAERIYSILESEILPIYFEQDEHGLSKRWMGYVKQIIAEVAPHFTMKRMLDDYYDRFYNPLFISAKAARQDDYAPAKDFAEWKVDLQQRWSGLQTLNIELPQKEFDTLPVGEPFSVSVALSLNGIPPEHLRVEVLFFEREGSDQLILQSSAEFQLAIDHGAAATYSVTFDPQLAGDYEYGFRVSPKHPMMPHQQDLSLVYWA